MLTAYDASMASLLQEAGVDLLLVGDSLGNVVLGHETTLTVTLPQMIHHGAAVVRGAPRSFVVVDMPFGACRTTDVALDSAVQILNQTGAQAVKLEGGHSFAPTVARLVDLGIPVMGHIGLMPQSVHQIGGYRMHGKSQDEITYLLESANALEKAGAFALVLECVVPELAREITESIRIPTIGIGSGAGCSGQVLVINDLLGLGTRPVPKFVRPTADLAPLIRSAVSTWIQSLPPPAPSSVLPAPEREAR